MKIARFASYALAGLSVLFALSCTKNKEEEKPASEASSAKFKVALNLVESNRAEVIVRHDGKDSDTWFGFITDDIETPEADLIQAQLPNVSKSTLHVGAIQTVEVKNLEEYSKYRYIAFGVTEDKELFGTPGSLVFSTNPDLDAKFAVEVSAITSSSAKASVTMEGKSYLTYYVAISEDTTSSDAEIAAAAYSDIVKDGELLEGVKLLTGASNELSFETLKADTQYSVVAFGVFVDEEGSALYYGTPAVAKFATTPDYSKIAFTATPVTVGKNIAKFNVTYDTESEMSWYAFVTKDIEATASSLISAAVADITADDWNKGEGEVSFEELQAMTKYRIIVTGIKEDGIFGVPADVTFMTTDEDYDEIVFTAQFVEADKTSATIKVSNSTANDVLRWTYVVTTDLTKEAAQLLPAAADVAPENVFSGNDKEITITGLNGGTVYRVIVAGYREDDNNDKYIYGTPADLQFNTASAYSINEAWVLQYNGKKVYNGHWYLFVGIHNTDGAKVDLQIFTKQAFDAAGIIDALLEKPIEDGKALLAAGATIDDITYTDNETDSQSWLVRNPLEAGDYVAVIYDVDDAFNPLGSYQKVEYTIAPSTASSDYNAWLGNWTATNDSGAEVWTVTASVPGETYKIRGLCNMDVEIEAVFDPSNKTLCVSAQGLGDVKTINTSDYGEIEAQTYLFGSSSNGIYGGTRLIFTATISGDTATLTPAKDPKNASFSSARFFLSAMDPTINSLWYTDSRAQLALPQTIKRPESASPAYLAWIGTWNIDRPEYTEESSRGQGDNAPTGGVITDTWVITEKTANLNYEIAGIDGFSDPIVATFDSATGKMRIAEQKITSFENSGTTYVVYLMGLFSNNESIWGGTEQIVEGVIGSNGTATLTGCQFTGQSTTGEITDTFTGMEVFFLNGSGQLVNFGADNWGEFYTYPAALKPASATGSSIKAIRSNHGLTLTKHNTRATKDISVISATRLDTKDVKHD